MKTTIILAGLSLAAVTALILTAASPQPRLTTTTCSSITLSELGMPNEAQPTPGPITRPSPVAAAVDAFLGAPWRRHGSHMGFAISVWRVGAHQVVAMLHPWRLDPRLELDHPDNWITPCGVFINWEGTQQIDWMQPIPGFPGHYGRLMTFTTPPTANVWVLDDAEELAATLATGLPDATALDELQRTKFRVQTY